MSADEIKVAAKDDSLHFGDAPDDPGPVATDLPADLTSDAILKAVRKVADWELARHEPYFNQVWTFGALYPGFLAASGATGDAKYHDAMMAFGEKTGWKLGPKPTNADDICVG